MLELMLSVDRNAGSAHPPTQEDVNAGQEFVVRLYAGCRSLFRATYELLESDHSEEARILSRTLLDDTAKLHFLLRNQAALEEWIESFHLQSLYEGLGLVRFERSISLTGAEGRERRLLDAITERRNKSRALLGKDLRPFPDTSEIVKQLGERELYWFFKVASLSVHTSIVSLEARARQVAEGHMVVEGKGTLETFLMVGLLACEMFTTATVDAVAMLGWGTLQEVDSYREHVRGKVRDVREEAQRAGYLPEYENSGDLAE